MRGRPIDWVALQRWALQIADRALAHDPLHLMCLVEQSALRDGFRKLRRKVGSQPGCIGRCGHQRLSPVQSRRGRWLAIARKQGADQLGGARKAGELVAGATARIRSPLAIGELGNDQAWRAVDYHQLQRVAGLGSLGQRQR